MELKKRIFTAVAGVSCILGLLGWGGPWGAWTLGFVIAIASMFELTSLACRLSDQNTKLIFSEIGILFIFLGAVFWNSHSAAVLVFLGQVVLGVFLAQWRAAELKEHLNETFALAFGAIYIGLFLTYFYHLRNLELGFHWVVLFLLVNWTGDTGAYFGGKHFGKKKLFPVLSPKKTIEGAWVGTLLSVSVAVGYALWKMPSISWWVIGLIAIIVSIFAQIGDLAESFMKRAFDRKDSASILPGHGGFLDRFDGVIMTLPIMYFIAFLTEEIFVRIP